MADIEQTNSKNVPISHWKRRTRLNIEYLWTWFEISDGEYKKKVMNYSPSTVHRKSTPLLPISTQMIHGEILFLLWTLQGLTPDISRQAYLYLQPAKGPCLWPPFLMQLLGQRDELSPCLFSCIWQGIAQALGQIEWRSYMRVSSRDIKLHGHHDTRSWSFSGHS